MKYFIILIAILTLGILTPKFINNKDDAGIYTNAVRTSTKLFLDNPMERLMLVPGKIIIENKFNNNTFYVKAITVFGIKFADLQVFCDSVQPGSCSVTRTNSPETLEINYSEQTEQLNRDNYNTQGWKVHTSSWKYEIKYKPNWIIRTVPKESVPMLLEDLYVLPKDIPYGPAPLLQISVQDGDLSTFLDEVKSSKRIYPEITRVNFNGNSGLKTVNPHTTEYVLENRNKLYIILFSPSEQYAITPEEEMAALTSFVFQN